MGSLLIQLIVRFAARLYSTEGRVIPAAGNRFRQADDPTHIRGRIPIPELPFSGLHESGRIWEWGETGPDGSGSLRRDGKSSGGERAKKKTTLSDGL
jgi:hypothetical protein